MAQPAYDFDRFATKEVVREEKAPLRSVTGGKREPSFLQKIFSNSAQVAVALFFMGTAFALLQSEVQMTELVQQTQRQEQAYVVAQNEYNYLSNELSENVNMLQIEKIAKQNGLVKRDVSQVTYIRLDHQASVTVEPTSFEKCKTFLSGLVAQMLACLNFETVKQ